MKLMSNLMLMLLTLTSVAAWAGSQAEGERQFAPEQISRFAKGVEKYAAAKGARAFIIGRQGRPTDELPAGVEFTHTAIAIYSVITLPDGSTAKGYAVHNLYQTATDLTKSELVTDYPVDFFWPAYTLRGAIVIPSPALQQRLVAAFASGVDEQVHRPAYSVLASPYNDQYQNCTEHTLDVINAAIYQTTDYAQLKANTRAYFHAQPIKVGGLKRLFANMVMEDFSTRDQQGEIETATLVTIAAYLQQNQLLQEAVVIDSDGVVAPLPL